MRNWQTAIIYMQVKEDYMFSEFYLLPKFYLF